MADETDSDARPPEGPLARHIDSLLSTLDTLRQTHQRQLALHDKMRRRAAEMPEPGRKTGAGGKAGAAPASLQPALVREQRRADRLVRIFARTADRIRRVAASRAAIEAERDLEIARMARRNGALQRVLMKQMRLTIAPPRQEVPTRFDMPEGTHGYIPIDISAFLDLLMRLDALLALDPDFAADDMAYRPVRFLEVGCGSGRNVIIARDCGLLALDRIFGFDINTMQIAAGRRSLDLDEEIGEGDALDFDYSGWDVIFSYRPFSDPVLQRRLEAHMAASMRRGAYLLAPLAADLTLYPALARSGVHPDIWKKTG
jgi:SAM-dependent methyltransferase